MLDQSSDCGPKLVQQSYVQYRLTKNHLTKQAYIKGEVIRVYIAELDTNGRPIARGNCFGLGVGSSLGYSPHVLVDVLVK